MKSLIFWRLDSVPHSTKNEVSSKDFLNKCDQIARETADLVTFTGEILNGKLHFLSCVSRNLSSSIKNGIPTTSRYFTLDATDNLGFHLFSIVSLCVIVSISGWLRYLAVLHNLTRVQSSVSRMSCLSIRYCMALIPSSVVWFFSLGCKCLIPM